MLEILEILAFGPPYNLEAQVTCRSVLEWGPLIAFELAWRRVSVGWQTPITKMPRKNRNVVLEGDARAVHR